MVTQEMLSKVLLIAQAMPVAAALQKLLDLNEEAGYVMPEYVLVALETALWHLEEMEERLLDTNGNAAYSENEPIGNDHDEE